MLIPFFTDNELCQLYLFGKCIAKPEAPVNISLVALPVDDKHTTTYFFSVPVRKCGIFKNKDEEPLNSHI